MELSTIGRVLMGLGVALVAVGGLLWVGGRLGLGRLPGDLRFDVGGARVSIPIVTSIVISVVATIVLNLLLRR